MTADDRTEVQPAKLMAHASAVDRVADEVAVAKRAGDAVRLGAGAYGQLCIAMPIMVDNLQGIVLDGIDAALHSLHDTADRLRNASRTYQSTDEQHEAALNRLRDAL